MNGAGNPNIYKDLKHGEGLQKWHFLYFAYSRKERKAYGYYQHKDHKLEATFTNVNHYLANNFMLFVAKDRFYPSYNGKIAHLRLVLCAGAYDPKFPKDSETPKTPTPTPSTPTPTPPPSTPTPPTPSPTCVEGVK